MVRRTKEEAQETRSQILEAAEKAFYERGVARTTLADIATMAGVTRGAIYWHFSNKADLVQAMLDSLHEPLDELAKPVKAKTSSTRWLHAQIADSFVSSSCAGPEDPSHQRNSVS